jgi:hypothetical protein
VAVEFWDWQNILTVFILTFSFFLLLTGAFTAYFGSGKSRKVGAGLLAGGAILLVLWIVIAWMDPFRPDAPIKIVDIIIQSLGVLLWAILGAGAAIGLFLLAIMKS